MIEKKNNKVYRDIIVIGKKKIIIDNICTGKDDSSIKAAIDIVLGNNV
ncbi:hypothetical protein [Clostridium paraputrificum]|nr:hypothetical protein [Clostridium paraputrificum]